MGVFISVTFISILGSVVGVVLYSVDLGAVSVAWMCHGSSDQESGCLRLASIAQVGGGLTRRHRR